MLIGLVLNPEIDRTQGDILIIARELRDNKGLSCNKYHYTYQQSELSTGPQNNAYSPNICILFLGLDIEWIRGIKDAAIKEGLTKKETRTIQETLNLDASWKSASMREERISHILQPLETSRAF